MVLAMSGPRIRLGEVSVGLTQSLAQAVRESGHDPKPLLTRYGLDNEQLAQPDARLSISRYMHLGHAALRQTGNEALGLDAARHARLSLLGVAGLTARHAPDLRQALGALIRFEPLFMQNYRGHSSLHEDTDGVWLRFYSISPYNDYNRFAVDTQLAGWRQQCTEVVGKPVAIERVQLEFEAPHYASRYEEVFGCKIEFGATHSQLRLRHDALSLPGNDHCPGTWAYLLNLCETELARQTQTYSTRERVVQVLGPLLHGREPELEQVAHQLNVPPWTLRRKLADEGTGFRELLAGTRRDLAVAYIKDTELSFGEIAYLLGFSSAEAFQRAFKRWCECTPGEYRRQARQSS
jgi:AraC-like DNA-binding protein